MKSSKLAAVLVHVILILLAALLIKQLVAIPQSATAASNRNYFLKSIEAKHFLKDGYFELNNAANQGWRLVSAVYNTRDDSVFLILER
jgi:hypothetical protein